MPGAGKNGKQDGKRRKRKRAVGKSLGQEPKAVTMCDLEALEMQAGAQAAAAAAAMLQRPDQLERLDVLKKRAERRRAAVDAMLKTAVQTQLEGIREGLAQLGTAASDLKVINQNLDTMRQTLEAVGPLRDRLAHLRAEHTKHRQYAAAMHNLDAIYNVPKSIEETHELIAQGRLLQAHKNLMELERARDELMFEVHRLESCSDKDKQALSFYFNDVSRLAVELSKQLWYMVGRTLEAVRQGDPGPQQLVTAVRIIEREQRIDEYCVRQAEATGFKATDRPRGWRQKAFEVLQSTVSQRIEGNQLEDRSLNKQWLARYLETIRLVTLEDLRVARTACEPCFPDEYNIYERYIRMYHGAISKRLREMAEDELEKNELVQMLGWINQYTSDHLLGNRVLDLDGSFLHELLDDAPLLPRPTAAALVDRYLELTRIDVTDWMEKALQHEKDDWYKCAKPEVDSRGKSYTQLPNILFQMIEDQVQLAREIGPELVPNVVFIHVEKMAPIADTYKDAFAAYRVKHFEDRSRFARSFTQTIVACANNSDTCVEYGDKLKKHVRVTMEGTQLEPTPATPPALSTTSLGSGGAAAGHCWAPHVHRAELLRAVDAVKEKWMLDRHAAVMILLDELMLDLHEHLAKLLTKQWLTQGGPVEVICETIKDYHADFKLLRAHIFEQLLVRIQTLLLFEYLKAMEKGRMSCAGSGERRALGDRLKREATLIRDTFDRMHVEADDRGQAFEHVSDVLSAMAEVVYLDDRSMLPLEVSGFVRKYADITEPQLTGLIALREDCTRAEAKSLAVESLHHNRIRPPNVTAYTRLFQFETLGEETLKEQASSTFAQWNLANFSLNANVVNEFSEKVENMGRKLASVSK